MRTVAGTAVSAVATVVIAATAVLTAAGGAQAHDALVASSPAPDSHLDEAPSIVTLTFSAEVLEIGAAVVVDDAAGHDWVADPVVVTRDTVTATLTPGLPDGSYQVRWRIVSADGHPISDVFAFSVGDVQDAARPAPADDPTDSSSSPVPMDQSTNGGGAALAILLGVAGAVAAAAVYLIIRFILTRRARRGGPGSTAA
jgi:methionine-rich copper-binding protein CopC